MASSNTLPLGSMLLHYQLESILGQGGFGITYLARDTRLNLAVAIKEFFPKEFVDRDDTGQVLVRSSIGEQHEIWTKGLDRFLKEAQFLAQFHHPNIVQVLYFFEANNTGYMVMRFEEGEELGEFLKRRIDVDERETMGIILPILSALDMLHRAGVVHRDLKPGNIYIRRDGTPMLLDFGSARQLVEGQHKSVTMFFTPGYAPFEQYHSSSNRQGPWTDIYSLGAVMYRMATGRKPVPSSDRVNAYYRGEPDPMRSAVDVGEKTFSKTVLEAIDWATNVMEKDRPQAVEAWRQVLVGVDKCPKVGRTAVKHADTEEDATKFNPAGSGKVDGPPVTTENFQDSTKTSILEVPPPTADDPQDAAAHPTAEEGSAPQRGGSWRLVGAVLAIAGVLVGGGLGVQEYLAWQTSRPAPTAASPPEESPVETAVESPTRPLPNHLEVWKEPVTGMTLVWISPGTFLMGQRADETAHLKATLGETEWKNMFSAEQLDGKPFQTEFPGLWVGKTEVTVAQFRHFVEATKYKTDAEKDFGNKKGCFSHADRDHKREWGWFSGRSWRDPGFPQEENHPVVCVSWQDAWAFGKWLSGQSGATGEFRLPTEREWEYVARAGTATWRSWSNDQDGKKACTYANVFDHTGNPKAALGERFDCTDGYPFTAPAGHFKANAFGLNDLLGNVWEWTCSEWGKYEDPQKSFAKCSTIIGARSYRGGGWLDGPAAVRSATRRKLDPGFRNNLLGFRLVKMLK